MATVDLYTVLNLEQDCSRNDIKRAYRKLVLLYHPDRPTGDEEMFELVQHAYNILSNPSDRKEYDRIFNITKQANADFERLQGSSRQYLESQKNYTNITDKEKEQFYNDFNRQFEELDLKHGYKRNNEQEIITESNANKRMKDLMFARDQDDIETTHEKIFDSNNSNFLERFNEAWELKHKSQHEIVPHTGDPMAWDFGGGMSYSGVDNYEELYTDNVGNSTDFGDLNYDRDRGKKLTREEVEKLKGASYVKGHNQTSKTYQKDLERLASEHRQQMDTYNNREKSEYRSDYGSYGIMDRIGIDMQKALEFDNEDISKKYQKMKQLRMKND